VGYASVRENEGRFTYVPARVYWAHGDPVGTPLGPSDYVSELRVGTAHTTALDLARD
jgi:hypothetical protein